MRLFIGIHFPEDIIDRINLLQGELRSKIKGGRFPVRENMHLTLQFLGETLLFIVKSCWSRGG